MPPLMLQSLRPGAEAEAEAEAEAGAEAEAEAEGILHIPARLVPARREFGMVRLGRYPLCQTAKLNMPVKKVSFKCTHRCLRIL